jgi:hypothetical protein
MTCPSRSVLVRNCPVLACGLVHAASGGTRICQCRGDPKVREFIDMLCSKLLIIVRLLCMMAGVISLVSRLCSGTSPSHRSVLDGIRRAEIDVPQNTPSCTLC